MQDSRRVDRIVSRRNQGLTYRELGNEFGHAPSHIHKLVNNATQATNQAMGNNLAVANKAASDAIKL